MTVAVTSATRAAVELARAHHDSWIAVTDEVDGLIASGADLDGLLPALVSSAPSATCALPTTHGSGSTTTLDSDDVLVIDAASAQYPAELGVVPGRPLLLYIKGTFPTTPKSALAIVGSRQASPAGRRAAFEIARSVAAAGHPVISGLAAGVDTAAHEGALAAGGVTVAVMGTGIDQVFPAHNADLADRIAAEGALVSQFAPGQGPSKTTFPARNALIAALSDASLLVELAERSGTRIEAERALEQQKPVWLWAPILAGVPWAKRYVARQAGASFVNSIDEVLRHLASLEDA